MSRHFPIKTAVRKSAYWNRCFFFFFFLFWFCRPSDFGGVTWENQCSGSETRTMMIGWRGVRILLCTYVVVSLCVWLTIDANGVSKIFDDTVTDRRESFDYTWNSSNALARSALVERQERLQYNCDIFTSRNRPKRTLVPDDFRNLIVDEKHELLYCYVPKVCPSTISY